MNNKAGPPWLKPELFTNIIANFYDDFLKIKRIIVKPALNSFENSITSLFRITIKVKLKDNTSKKQNFVLKIPLSDEYRLLFLYENDMYAFIVKELEDICTTYNTKVEFKARNFWFSDKNLCNTDYILMEDLLERNFRNPMRLSGLNELETKVVLSKLAQWHAASMKRVERGADYSAPYRDGFFIEDQRSTIENMNKIFQRPFIECLRATNLNKDIKRKAYEYTKKLTELYLKFGRVNVQQVNVLNHGDLWLNNLMLQYDDFDNLQDVIFIDFQMPKYGNPSQDLFWFLLSSTHVQIMLNKFDELIAFYHGSLISHLRQIGYRNVLPNLGQLQETLREGGVWAFITIQRLLPIVLMDPYENTTLEAFMNQNLEGLIARKRLFYNPRYVEQINKLLPWLFEREYMKCD